MRFLRAFALLVLPCLTALADPLTGGLQLGTSVSQAYDGRSILTNPAAMGFQTELNGADLATSFLYGFNRQDQRDDFALGTTLGPLGFGWERMLLGGNTLSRYRFGLGVPLHPQWFLGARYVLNRFDSATGYDTVDVGMQFRPAHWVSFGLMANAVNQPQTAGGRLPWQLVGGLTVRPHRALELSLDADTLSGDATLFKRFGYQAVAAVEPWEGVKLRVGYHEIYHWQAGLELRLGRTSLSSVVQPDASLRHVVAGIDFTATPYRSPILESSTLKLAINGQLEEKPASGSLFASWHPTLLELIETLDRAAEHSSIRRVTIRLESFPLGLAAAEEVHFAIRRVRAAGKTVEVHLGNGGLKEYLIAAAADKIVMEPQGELKLLGLRSEHYYLKGTLDKIGIEGEFLWRGEYKSAPEMFTRREGTPINRQAAWESLREARARIETLLSESRKLDKAALGKIFDTALFGAERAREAGLVDTVASYGAAKDDHDVEATGTRERSNALALPARIAVIVADGDILQHKSRALSLGGNAQITPVAMRRQFEQAMNDPRTAAIVLRVNSPGGEILPSHEIGVMVEKARERKPVVVSMGDVAASGGYYISAPASKVFAGPLTYTGSIGVFLGKVNAAGLYKWLQLNKEILSDFPHAALFSEDRPWSAQDKTLLSRRVDEYYGGFVSYVARHRGLDSAAAESAAKGRVWLGEKARALKLVDANGGYREAIRAAADLAGVEHYETETLQDAVGLFDLFSPEGLFGRGQVASSATRELAGLLSPGALRDLRWIGSLSESPFLYLSPIAFATE